MTETEPGPSLVSGLPRRLVPLLPDYQGSAPGQQSIEGPVVVRGSGTEWVISMVNPRPFLDLLVATVELATARSVLRELIKLADQAPGLTEEQLRFRLLALASALHPDPPLSPRSPAGCWSSETPDSAPGGQPVPHNMVRSAP